jgi:acetyltransferase-like isoleucine patch superfamily enzyme
MAYLSDKQLQLLGFSCLGKEVRISDKAVIYDPESVSIGDYSRIDDFCTISGLVVLGRNVHIAVGCNVAGGEKGVFFEDFVGIAYHSNVFSQSDDYTGASMTNPTVPDRFKLETKEAVIVRRHSIIGTASVVFPGVVIEEGCAIGALSLVTQSTDAWSIYAGRPARRIGKRKKDLLEMEERYLQEEET